jgi:hypothetical protein
MAAYVTNELYSNRNTSFRKNKNDLVITAVMANSNAVHLDICNPHINFSLALWILPQG